ncbi:acyloxyacyl hydrolase, partial [Pelagibacterales bacterium SAG-MED24]|nr:acyloxyacyl hydrolase [Pelagibacterales bacterium SAG-MED24]
MMLFKKLSLFFVVLFYVTNLFATEEIKKNVHQLNFFTGNFDFSDDKQSAYLIGFQHQDENLNRDTFLGNVSPITGGFVTENSAAYVYTGIEWNMNMGKKMFFTPSFAP